ncbi:VRR-NUC domain-containing protein [Acinetobacter chengduensis]|uniref:VRR-NUC domain-containing protein n=1 Tax=Acinetobacter chengduensis TaxID=2420890 RepID=A0ABX9TSN6_9GAMM|nr:VRR-NUC domain-containing protein [Acinetobacter chengduensis]RLL19025.1 VRR-NUC domain-containing protein [Acinetobacter chengduensis]
MSLKKRGKGVRPASLEELLQSKNKNKGVKPANSLSRGKTPISSIGLALEKPRRMSPKERERIALGQGPSEDEIQMRVIDWAKTVKWKNTTLNEYLHHSPNGGKRSKSEAGRFKAMGTKAGFPDLFLIVGVSPFKGLFIELKSAKGTVTDIQRQYHPMLIEEGYRVEVCFSEQGAISLISNYLGLRLNE